MELQVRGAFADVADIRDLPTPFTPTCDGHPLAPIAGPVMAARLIVPRATLTAAGGSGSLVPD